MIVKKERFLQHSMSKKKKKKGLIERRKEKEIRFVIERVDG